MEVRGPFAAVSFNHMGSGVKILGHQTYGPHLYTLSLSESPVFLEDYKKQEILWLYININKSLLCTKNFIHTYSWQDRPETSAAKEAESTGLKIPDLPEHLMRPFLKK